MPFFVILGIWMGQGIHKIAEIPARVKAVHNMLNKAGGKMQLFYTMWKYDFVAIIEAQKDEIIMAILLRLGNIGNIRTRIMRARKEAEAEDSYCSPSFIIQPQ